MSVVSCHSGEAVSRKREALLFRISSAKKFLLLDLSDEFGPFFSMAEYLTPINFNKCRFCSTEFDVLPTVVGQGSRELYMYRLEQLTCRLLF
jgi:hypothetical protein